MFVGNDQYTGRGGGAELRQHNTDHASIFDTIDYKQGWKFKRRYFEA